MWGNEFIIGLYATAEQIKVIVFIALLDCAQLSSGAKCCKTLHSISSGWAVFHCPRCF